LIDAHRGAFEYDWRARFHLPLTVVGKSMSWGEALRLARFLTIDPASAVAAALAGWSFPATREALALMDLYDAHEAGRVGRKARKYPRPWVDQSERSFGRTSLTREELRAILDAHRR
jgi:hypothetical protein